MCELKKARLVSIENEAKRGDIVRMIGRATVPTITTIPISLSFFHEMKIEQKMVG